MLRAERRVRFERVPKEEVISLGTVLLQGSWGALFLMGEVPL